MIYNQNMNQTFKLSKYLIIFGLPIISIIALIGIAKSSAFNQSSTTLSTAITVDLLLTIPLVYFLLIRKTNIPKTSVVPLVILGIVTCSLILPVENQYYLNLFKTWVLPVMELMLLSYVIYKIRKAINRYYLNKKGTFDFYSTLKETCYEILPKAVVIPFVTEIAVFYYGFFRWKKRTLKENEFSYHKTSGTISLLLAIILVVMIETVTLHVLVSKWSETAAWILTILSIYSGIQLFGFLKSMYYRPIVIEPDTLYLRYGIMNEAIIDLTSITSVEISSKNLESNHETRKLSFLGDLESHNVVIKLKEEHTLVGLYGIRHRFKNLVLHVDDADEFKLKIDEAIEV